MLHEAPLKRIGQIVLNQTVTSGSPLILIPFSANLRGAILRTCIISADTLPTTGTGQLVADANMSLTPPGTPSTARRLLVTGPSGFAQLDWPFYLDPGLGLFFDPGPPTAGMSYTISASWDYATLPA